MSCRRRLHGDPRRLLVADLADQDHVRVAAEDRAQAAGEREPGGWVDLHLRRAGHLVLDRILDRDDHAAGIVEDAEGRVERGGLAAARRADGDDRAVGALDRPSQDRLRRRVHPQLRQSKWALRPSALQDPENGLLAEGGREHRDPQVHRPPAHADAHPAVLRHAALRDVQPAHHLQPCEHGRLRRVVDLCQLRRHPVDADADHEPVCLRLEMDVGGAVGESLRDHVVHEPDRGGGVVQVEPLIRLLVRAPGIARERLDGADPGVVGAGDRLCQLVAVRDDDPRVGAQGEAEVVVGDDVRGVGDRDDQRSVLDSHGKCLVAPGAALGQPLHRLLFRTWRRSGRRTRARAAPRVPPPGRGS